MKKGATDCLKCGRGESVGPNNKKTSTSIIQSCKNRPRLVVEARKGGRNEARRGEEARPG